MRIYIIIALAAAIFTIHQQAKGEEGDWSATILLGSHHTSDNYTCNGQDRDYNESNPGLLIGYKWFFVGRFENSHSGCDDYKYSNVVGAEAPLGQLGFVQFSVTAGIADGYPEDYDSGSSRGFGEYMPWASINGRVGPVKIFYGYKVIALGLTHNF